MKIINLQSGTPEWHEWRLGGVGASDVPAIMGVCPYKTALDIYNIKMGQNMNVVTPVMQRGIDYEEEARQVFMRKLFCEPNGVVSERMLFKPILVEHEENPMYRASLDGYCSYNRYLCEIKVPGAKTMDMARYGQIPSNYLMQILWQMYVTDCIRAFYACYNPDTLEMYVVEVIRDEEMIANILIKVNEFIEGWKNGLPPKSKNSAFRLETSETQKKLQELISLKEQEKNIKFEYQNILESLLEEVGIETSLENENYILYRGERENIDYRQAALDAKADLNKYKKPISVSWTIKKKEAT